MAQVVEDEQRVAEHEHGVRQLEIVVGGRRQALHVTDHVVRKVPDGAALEARQTRHGHRLELAEQPAQGFERITVGEPLGAPAAPHGDPPVFRRQHRVGIAAEERVARPLLTALDRLEEERVGARPEPQVRGQRRVEVGGELGEHGDEVASSGELVELVACRRQRRDR